MSWRGWCRHCRAEFEGEPGFLPPFDCGLCGDALELIAPTDLQARLLAEHVARALKRTKRSPGEGAPAGRAHSFLAVAKMLRVRKSTIAAHVASGAIATVPIGKRKRIAETEVARLLRVGLSSPSPSEERDGSSRPRAPRRRAQRAESNSAAAAPTLRTFRTSRPPST